MNRRVLIFCNVCVIMTVMSVHEVLSFRERGIDYVDENGDVQFGTHGDDRIYEDELHVEELIRAAEAEGLGEQGGVAVRQLFDSMADRIAGEADKRGISYEMAALALGFTSDNLATLNEGAGVSDVRPRALSQPKHRPRRPIRGRRGLEPASASLVSMEIDRAQAEAERKLGRSLSDEEMTTIASDVERSLRRG